MIGYVVDRSICKNNWLRLRSADLNFSSSLSPSATLRVDCTEGSRKINKNKEASAACAERSRSALSQLFFPSLSRPTISYLIFIIGLLSFVLTFPTVASGAEARIAVASNFIATIKRLKPQFEQQSGHKLTLHFGSTGKLYAQIINGAPFDLFLAADAVRPKKLEADGKAVAGSRFTYATGVLVLWIAEALVQPEKGKTAKTIFEQDEIKHISMTNPKLAPYGMAAKQFLQASNYWGKYQTRLLLGNNVAQTLQFVQSGGVGAGFIALAQVAAKKRNSASVWIIPTEKYMPLQQQAVLLKQGEDNLAAKAFIQFLKTKEVVKQIEEAGYSLEKEVNAKEGHGKKGDKKEKGSD